MKTEDNGPTCCICGKKADVMVEGNHYCKDHDPLLIKGE